MAIRKEVTFLTNLTPDIYASYESLTGQSIGWKEKEGWKFNNTVVLEIDSETVNYGVTRTFSVKPVTNSVAIEWHGTGNEPDREFDPQYKRIGATFKARFEEASTPNTSNQRFEQSFSTGSCTWGGGASEAAVLNSYTAKTLGVDQLLAKFYPNSTFTLYISFYCEEYSYTSEEYQTNFQTSIPITFSIASTTQISELSPSINIPSDVINEIVTVDHDTISNYAWYKAFDQFLPDGWPLVIRVPVKYCVGAKAKESWVETVGDSTLSSMYIGITYTGLESSPSAKIQSSNPFVKNESDDWSTTSFLFDSNITEHQTSTNVYIYLFARDSRNQLGKTLIQSLNPEIYKTPTIGSFTAVRAISETEISDEGVHPLLTASWTVWAPTGQTYYGSTKLDIKKDGEIIDTVYNALIQEAPTIFGDVTIPIEEGRVFDLVVYDSFKSSALSSTYIDSVYCTMDFLAGGKGITFGELALKEGFVNHMESSFEAPVSISHVDETDGSIKQIWDFDTDTEITKLNGDFKAIRSDGSSVAWSWNQNNGELINRSAFYCQNSDGTKNGFWWGSGSYAAYLATNMFLQSGIGFIKAQHTGTSWLNGPNAAPIQATTAHADNNSSLWPLASVKSQNGRWCIGTLGNNLEIYYMADSQTENYPTKQIEFIPSSKDQKGYANAIKIDGVELWKFIYPVGAVYLSFSSTSPASLFGGTWTQLGNGHYLRSATNTDTGGSEYHTHTLWDTGVGLYAMHHNAEYYAYVSSGGNWQSNYKITNAGNTASGGTTHSTGMRLTGSTGSTGVWPTFQNLYAWRRTA